MSQFILGIAVTILIEVLVVVVLSGSRLRGLTAERSDEDND